MRKTVHQQLPLVPLIVNHEHARELTAISERLEGTPETAQLVYQDLMRGVKRPEKGREGMSAEQVMRCALAKQLNGWSYDELSFHLADSYSYRVFCCLGMFDKAPKKSTLKGNIKRLSPETWEAIGKLLLLQAKEEGIEKGRTVRTDCTVEQTNIHQPTDSSLLFDCVRVLARLMEVAKQMVSVHFTNHSRRGKRRALAIQHAKTKRQQLPLYRDLLKVTERTVSYALQTAEALAHYQGAGFMDGLAAESIASDLKAFADRAKQVIDQTRRRVLEGEKVPASEKLVSIFETHTDIIIKDRRETLFGHKLALTTGRSGLILDCLVLEGNPADSNLATMMVQRQKSLYGRVPRQIGFDGGFASQENLEDIKELGVKDVSFSKTRFLKVTDMVKSTWVYRKLRRFRAGIEGGISFLKRCFGLARCTWKGLRSFRAYTYSAIVAHNLLVLARSSLR